MYHTPIPVKGRSHFGSNFWDAYSIKLNRDVNFYSDLEYDHWVLVETNPKVDFFCEQPKKIHGTFAGKKAASIFDMWVKYVDGTEEFIEIKYSDELKPTSKGFDKVFRQTSLQREWCLVNKYKYTIKTELDIRGNKIYLENMKTILPYLRYKKPAETEMFKILKEIKGVESITFDDLYRKHIMSKQDTKEILFYLIYSGKVKSNINMTPLGIKTEVWING